MSTSSKNDSISTRLRKLSTEDLKKRDIFGRTIIHLICIVGRADLLKQLLKNPNLICSIADYESGWTGLHYSIYYGRLSCARLLLDRHYDMIKIKDRNGLTALDIYHLRYNFRNLMIFPESIGENDTNYSQRLQNPDQRLKDVDDLIWWDAHSRGGSDVYTFGTNVNNQLGTGDSADKLLSPYRVEIKNLRLSDDSLSIADRLVSPRIKDIKLSKNHSIILTNELVNNVLISGNSSRGRLGNGSNLPNFRFSHMDFFKDDHIREVALSDDHSLSLTSDGDVYSWGLNNYYQLGYPTEKIKDKTDTYSNVPKRVLGALKKLKVRGISCSKIHSCAYSGDSVVLWGLNVGQMDFVSTGEAIKHGKLKGVAQVPREIRFGETVKQVIATEEATIVLLMNDECHILTNGNHLRFQLPLYKTLNNEFEFFRPSVFSKRKQILKLVSKDSTKIGILYNDGSVVNFGIDMFSKSSNIKYSTIWTPRNDHLKCVDVDIGKDGSIVICTKSGCVYKRVSRTSSSEFKFTKIDKISKIVKVSCDSLFSSFGFIKDEFDLLPMKLYKNKFKKDIAYISPLSESSPNRKQSELVKPYLCHDYIADFLHKPDIELDDDYDYHGLLKRTSVLDEGNEETNIKDPLLKFYKERWNSSQPLSSTFLELDHSKYLNLILHDDLKSYLKTTDVSSGKGYDLNLEIDGCMIPIHSSVLCFIEKLKEVAESDVVIDDMVFHKIDREGIIKIKNVHIQTLLILIHILYTGEFLKPWDSFQSEIPPLFSKVKTQTYSLLKQLHIIDELHRMIFQFHSSFKESDNFPTDMTILLKDGEEIRCCSYILRSRNAYFETFFSERWDKSNIIEFKHVDKEIFQIALNYIHGHEQLSLLDSYLELDNSVDFINVVFELIELSDELLLFGLKDFCQLLIKDFIRQDNVLLILHHSEILNCRKLIGQCLWFIYNNVDLFLADTQYYELLSETMIAKIDSYIRWLHRVNKTNPEDANAAWYDSESSTLINTFLREPREFNDIFLESDNFVPLFDVPPKKEVHKSPKLEPKKSKLPSPPPPLYIDKRKSGSIGMPSSSTSRKPSLSDSSVIEFTEDDFQPVISRRRKSSSNRRGSSVLSLQNITVSTPAKVSADHTSSSRASHPIPITTPSPSSYQSRNTSTESLRRPSWSEKSGRSPAALSPFSNWATSNTYSGTGSSPLLQNSWKSSPPTKVSSSPFVAPSKLSQKERKKLMKQSEECPKSNHESAKGSSPWKIPSGDVSSTGSSSLLSAREEAMTEVGSAPSLKGIIHEEEHRIYEIKVKEKERKSLAEVQQEEEFAIWWEEESKRVQNQMNLLDKESVPKRINTNGNKKLHRTKKRVPSAVAQRTNSVPL